MRLEACCKRLRTSCSGCRVRTGRAREPGRGRGADRWLRSASRRAGGHLRGERARAGGQSGAAGRAGGEDAQRAAGHQPAGADLQHLPVTPINPVNSTAWSALTRGGRGLGGTAGLPPAGRGQGTGAPPPPGRRELPACLRRRKCVTGSALGPRWPQLEEETKQAAGAGEPGRGAARRNRNRPYAGTGTESGLPGPEKGWRRRPRSVSGAGRSRRSGRSGEGATGWWSRSRGAPAPPSRPGAPGPPTPGQLRCARRGLLPPKGLAERGRLPGGGGGRRCGWHRAAALHGPPRRRGGTRPSAAAGAQRRGCPGPVVAEGPPGLTSDPSGEVAPSCAGRGPGRTVPAALSPSRELYLAGGTAPNSLAGQWEAGPTRDGPEAAGWSMSASPCAPWACAAGAGLPLPGAAPALGTDSPAGRGPSGAGRGAGEGAGARGAGRGGA